jgi:hypothetical protein
MLTQFWDAFNQGGGRTAAVGRPQSGQRVRVGTRWNAVTASAAKVAMSIPKSSIDVI